MNALSSSDDTSDKLRSAGTQFQVYWNGGCCCGKRPGAARQIAQGKLGFGAIEGHPTRNSVRTPLRSISYSMPTTGGRL